MASQDTVPGPQSALHRIVAEPGPAMAALLAVAFVTALSPFLGREPLLSDADSVLRLVMVRDLLAGQGWFDLHQYRMGIGENGTLMHWSRLIDGPQAAIVLLASAIGLDGEAAVMQIWPLVMMFATFYALARCARAAGGSSALFPAVTLGALLFGLTIYYLPGVLDHHSAQIALTLLLLLQFLEDGPAARRGAAGGCAAALMLAIGMETLLLVAMAGASAALHIFGNRDQRHFAASFGAAFAAATIAFAAVTIPPSRYLVQACDALSIVHVVIGVLGGLGLLAAAGLTGGRPPAVRVAILAALAVVIGVTAAVAFSDCLRNPLAISDSRLFDLWLNTIGEAKSIGVLIATDASTALAIIAVPLVAIAVLTARFAEKGFDPRNGIVGAALLFTFGVTCMQLRGYAFAGAVAIIPLSAWIARLRTASALPGASLRSHLTLIAAWVVSCHLAWAGLGYALFGDGEAAAQQAAVNGPAEPGGAKAQGRDDCLDQAALMPLATLPAGRIMTLANLGPAILKYTHHSVVAGNYHRNGEGILAGIDTFEGDADEARAIVLRTISDYVAICPGNNESRIDIRRAPDGFAAQLSKGIVPSWLQKIDTGAPAPLTVYRVIRP